MSLDRLIRCLDAAVADPASEDTPCARVQGVLQLAAGVELLAPHQRVTNPDRYARHLVHRDPAGRYSVVAMVWAPGQGTPVHDHGGLWGTEVVLQGRIRSRSYLVVPRFARPDRFHVALASTGAAGAGDAEQLVPPFDHHALDNPYDSVAVTLHVYGGDLRQCFVYREQADGWTEEICVLHTGDEADRRAA